MDGAEYALPTPIRVMTCTTSETQCQAQANISRHTHSFAFASSIHRKLDNFVRYLYLLHLPNMINE